MTGIRDELAGKLMSEFVRKNGSGSHKKSDENSIENSLEVEIKIAIKSFEETLKKSEEIFRNFDGAIDRAIGKIVLGYVTKNKLI